MKWNVVREVKKRKRVNDLQTITVKGTPAEKRMRYMEYVRRKIYPPLPQQRRSSPFFSNYSLNPLEQLATFIEKKEKEAEVYNNYSKKPVIEAKPLGEEEKEESDNEELIRTIEELGREMDGDSAVVADMDEDAAEGGTTSAKITDTAEKDPTDLIEEGVEEGETREMKEVVAKEPMKKEYSEGEIEEAKREEIEKGWKDFSDEYNMPPLLGTFSLDFELMEDKPKELAEKVVKEGIFTKDANLGEEVKRKSMEILDRMTQVIKNASNDKGVDDDAFLAVMNHTLERMAQYFSPLIAYLNGFKDIEARKRPNKEQMRGLANVLGNLADRFYKVSELFTDGKERMYGDELYDFYKYFADMQNEILREKKKKGYRRRSDEADVIEVEEKKDEEKENEEKKDEEVKVEEEEVSSPSSTEGWLSRLLKWK